MTWIPVWRQAHTQGLPFGWGKCKNETVVWHLPIYAAGNSLRIIFFNHYGRKNNTVKAMSIKIGSKLYPVTYHEDEMITIPVGSRIISDEIHVPLKGNSEIECRICMGDIHSDNNATEEEAVSYKGNVVMNETLPKPDIPGWRKKSGMYCPIPAIESIEIQTSVSPKVIAAFGDSITAMGRWVKPLQKRLYDTYGSKYMLVNLGISGNCLNYEKPGRIWKIFGEMGIKRFDTDVEGIEGLHTVIFGLGTNDISYATGKRTGYLNAEALANVTERLVIRMREQNLRVVAQTLSPRMGYSGHPAYSWEMNAERIKYNEWLKKSCLFDYVFDADAVVRNQEKPDWYDDRYHQGDYLHPNRAGGKILADAFDLSKLTGEEI